MWQSIGAFLAIVLMILKQMAEKDQATKEEYNARIKNFSDAVTSGNPSALAAAIDGLHKPFDPRPSNPTK